MLVVHDITDRTPPLPGLGPSGRADASYQRRWPSVHPGEQLRADGVAALPAQQRLAARIYARWLGFAQD